MTRFRLSSSAESDLQEAWLFIARDNVAAADRWLEAVRAKFDLLARHPDLGELRPELTIVDCRSALAGNYVMYYRPITDGIEVARVLHASRDLRPFS